MPAFIAPITIRRLTCKRLYYSISPHQAELEMRHTGLLCLSSLNLPLLIFIVIAMSSR
jgi:hypothetical protein